MIWHPIETAPMDGTNILLFADHKDDGSNQFVGHWHPTEGEHGPYGRFTWREQSGASIVAEEIVTHWMALPPPPRAEGDEEKDDRYLDKKTAAIRAARDESLNRMYKWEGWGVLAEKAGFAPVDTEASAREAFRWAWEELVEREAELIYLRQHGKDGAKWAANECKDVWRKYARESLATQ